MNAGPDPALALADLDAEELAIARAAVDEHRREKANREARQAAMERRLAAMTELNHGQGLDHIVVFGAGYNSDTTEGKGHTIWTGYFFDRHEAEEAVAWLPGVYGNPNTERIGEVHVFADIEAWKAAQGDGVVLPSPRRA